MNSRVTPSDDDVTRLQVWTLMKNTIQVHFGKCGFQWFWLWPNVYGYSDIFLWVWIKQLFRFFKTPSDVQIFQTSGLCVWGNDDVISSTRERPLLLWVVVMLTCVQVNMRICLHLTAEDHLLYNILSSIVVTDHLHPSILIVRPLFPHFWQWDTPTSVHQPGLCCFENPNQNHL